MNALYLKFNLSHTDGVEFDEDALRHELSTIIDAALKKSGQGHWDANRIKNNQLQVKCSVHNPELARAQIEWALSKHWLAQHLLFESPSSLAATDKSAREKGWP